MNQIKGQEKRVFIKTYGCQMNVYDSERMTDALAADGYVPVAEAESADLILLNTCHIREKAAEKVYSDLGRFRQFKESGAREGRKVTIGVAGCVAQAEAGEIIRRAREVDFVVGPQAYQRLPEILAETASGGRPVATDFAVEEKFAALGQPGRKQPGRVAAFITVQEGCDKFCTFCVVPYTRGAEVSRSAEQIVDEARRLADEGVREVTLLGQNVNAWHGAGPDGRTWGLGELLHRLAEIRGLDRLRYTTSHPRDMDEALIAAHRDLEALMPYLHIPVQAGSDRVLAAMNRRHSRADYLHLVEKVRKARPDIAIAGDFIVGFPGESDDDFAETLSIVGEVEYASAFSFKYSPRPGTPAAAMEQVPEEVKSERLQRLQAAIHQSQIAFNRSRLGQTTGVLFERRGRYPGQIVGRTPWLAPLQAEGPETLIGSIAPVEVMELSANSLFGRIAAEVPAEAMA